MDEDKTRLNPDNGGKAWRTHLGNVLWSLGLPCDLDCNAGESPTCVGEDQSQWGRPRVTDSGDLGRPGGRGSVRAVAASVSGGRGVLSTAPPPRPQFHGGPAPEGRGAPRSSAAHLRGSRGERPSAPPPPFLLLLLLPRGSARAPGPLSSGTRLRPPRVPARDRPCSAQTRAPSAPPTLPFP